MVKGKERGFTLIELLMVITIISILVALLLPALQTAKSKAKYARWTGIKQSNRFDPDCILYYTFERSTINFNTNQVNSLAQGNTYITEFDPDKLTADIVSGMTYYTAGGRFSGKGYMVSDGSTAGKRIDLPLSSGAAIQSLNFADKTGFTLEAWVNIYNNKDYNIVCYMQDGNVGSIENQGSPGFYLRVRVDGTPQALFTDGGSSNLNVNSTTYTLSTRKWYHLVATVDNATGYFRLYINGENDVSGNVYMTRPPASGPGDPATYNTNNIFVRTTSWFRIGVGDYWWTGGATTLPFDGIVDEVAIFSRALTASEIRARYQAGSP